MAFLLLLLSALSVHSQVPPDLFKSLFHRLVPFKSSNNETVLVAEDDITAGDALAAIDLQACLVSFDQFPLSDKLVEEPEDIKLVTRLLYERFVNQENTIIRQWAKSLPRGVTNSFSWREEDFAELQKANVFQHDLGSASEIKEKFHQLNASVYGDLEFPQELLSLENYIWGYAQMFIRCAGLKKEIWAEVNEYDWFKEESDEEKSKMGIVCYPLLDLAGYCLSTLSRIAGIQLKKIDKNYFGVLIAERNFTKSQRFCLNYPQLPNANLLFLKGQVLEKNRFDTAWVELEGSGKVSCPGSKAWVRKCTFAIEYNGLNKAMLQYIREDRASGRTLAAIPRGQFLAYYYNLTTTMTDSSGTGGETKRDFVLSLRQYRAHVVEDVLGKRFHRTLRDVRRDKHMHKTLRTFTVSTFMIPYNHLEHVDRLLMKTLMDQLQF